jgi:hypothetical protein
MGARGADRDEHRLEVGVGSRVPVLVAHAEDEVVLGDARVVDEDVDAAEFAPSGPAERETSATWRPSFARRSAMALPMPREAPVTIAVRVSDMFLSAERA